MELLARAITLNWVLFYSSPCSLFNYFVEVHLFLSTHLKVGNKSVQHYIKLGKKDIHLMAVLRWLVQDLFLFKTTFLFTPNLADRMRGRQVPSCCRTQWTISLLLLWPCVHNTYTAPFCPSKLKHICCIPCHLPWVHYGCHLVVYWIIKWHVVLYETISIAVQLTFTET